MGGSIERNGCTYICQRPVSTFGGKSGKVLQTYIFDVLQILDVGHFTLDKLEDDAAGGNVARRPPESCIINKGHSRLALCNLFRNLFPHILRHQVVPLKLPCRSLAHRRLECLQLSNTLKVPHGLNRFFQEIDVGVPFRSLRPDGFEDKRVFV